MFEYTDYVYLFPGAAKAFNMSTYSHPDIVQLLKDYFGSNLDAPKLKMAQVLYFAYR